VIERKGERWVLNKKEGAWSFEGREDLKLDPEKVEVFVRPTLWAEAQSFEEEEATDLKPYGLDAPQVRVSLSDEYQTEEILYGNQAPPDRVFAMVKGKPQLVTVRKRLLDDLPQTQEDLVEKEKKEEKWSLEGHEDLKLDPEKVEVFVRPTVWAEAMSFEKEEVTDLKPYGLDAPQARVGLSDGTQSEEIIYGKDAAPDRVFALVKGKPQLVTVRKRLLDDLPKTTEELVEKEKKEETKS
ncbi:MAG: DUF4340 domain-containing protein, partial [Deltaproteobacteria bacterium]